MKKILTYILLFAFIKDSKGQSCRGITGKPDTSFTTYSAFEYTKKEHPDVKMVYEFTDASIKEKRGITYCDINGRQLQLDAFYPAADPLITHTAIIIIHGGGWRSGSRTQHYPLAQKLASLGYACFTPEYRLSTEALFPAGVYDVKAAIRWVKANAKDYKVDTNHVIILGFSAGGELAAFMGTTGNMPLFEGTSCSTYFGSNVNAVIDIDGTLSFDHPEGGEGDDSKGISAATYWFGYPKKDNPMLWKAASPLSYVSAKTPPTLFLNSAVTRMHAGREDYIKVLDTNNIYSEVHTFEGAPHSFCLFEPWFNETVGYVDKFLKKIFANK